MPTALSTEQQARILNFYYLSFSTDVSLMTGIDLANSGVSSQPPLEIADLNGSALFRDFAILGREGQKIGILRSSARGADLPLIDAVMIGQSLFEPAAAERDCMAKALQDYMGATVRSLGFVCYGYPRVGVLVEVTRADKVVRAVYDAHMTMLVQEVAGTAGRVAADRNAGSDVEGVPFYSYLSQMPEAGEVPVYADEWRRAASHMTAVTRTLAARARLTGSKQLLDELRQPGQKDAGPGELPEDVRPAMHGITLPIALIGQETPVYCAVATIKMILTYLGSHDITQAAIAQAVHTGSNGTTNDNMILGLNGLTGGKWTASLADSPSTDDSSRYLSGFVPAKSGIPGHARLLRGFREYVYMDPATGLPSLRQTFYLVNDPYPTGHGQYTMENARKPIDGFYRNLLKLQPAT